MPAGWNQEVCSHLCIISWETLASSIGCAKYYNSWFTLIKV